MFAWLPGVRVGAVWVGLLSVRQISAEQCITVQISGGGGGQAAAGPVSLRASQPEIEAGPSSCSHQISLPYSHRLPRLCGGRILLSCRPVAALIWLRDCPRSRKSQPGSTEDGHTEQVLRLGLHPSCLQAAWVDWGSEWGRQGRAPWSHIWRYDQILQMLTPLRSLRNPKKWLGHGTHSAVPTTLT